ncbi:riboflavin synthase [Parageobacillus thermoglucosidasius]|jgi:riboflavin synthase|uniref:Riboflavin synthase n=1 Tax=Parageobacillus thermoglucosidasius TaxID=1426 RepID=A0AAN0YQB1_PARTM|nr:riboflavin synthase [Parageobacillus thermoglucosidasius]ALF11399.1 riboflavin synthase subunit alpha [Parageobacillus thermoglucosidasius]ANZ31477.1 riboflavin synthase subunit alpha [Parageobacillus thermoglucosidasius]APM82214.1 riboflavin synthase subunit alpha [Parageobacillus thermoglucosidasius]KJX69057.1 riboflavin synthase subunit alpha [Parageobacillus thermoglucosidasius]RDE25951.1 riboflavin synthase [Parageobacillus thermoglucosidasius]
MFTGIIEEVGTIEQMRQSGEAIVMTIGAEKILEDIHLGDSIAVNGVCLTVTSFTQRSFTVDVMPETVKATSLRTLTRGSKVNLERAMPASGRFGGHFVSGHVDGVGEIIRKWPVANAVYYEIQIPKELRKYMILKGSVAVDGTSLTIFGLTDDTFTISLIPHTRAATILGDKQPGDIVNIECDVIGKYVAQFMEGQKEEAKPAITLEFLERHGYK